MYHSRVQAEVQQRPAKDYTVCIRIIARICIITSIIKQWKYVIAVKTHPAAFRVPEIVAVV